MRIPRPTGNAGEIVKTAVLACLLAGLLVSSVAMVSAAGTIDIGPKVGDILVFQQGARMPSDWAFTATTTTTTTTGDTVTTCDLQPVAMAAGGGSLVVEERFQDPRTYRVHWAGERTANGATDCGNSAELVLPVADLQLLSNAVGGAGVEHRAFSGF
jgi:hypothetical protein